MAHEQTGQAESSSLNFAVECSQDSHISSKKTIDDYRYFSNVICYFHDRVPIDAKVTKSSVH